MVYNSILPGTIHGNFAVVFDFSVCYDKNIESEVQSYLFPFFQTLLNSVMGYVLNCQTVV